MFLKLTKKLLLVFLLITSMNSIKAQHFTISGFITDSQTGEVLIGAYVFCPQTGMGSVTNNYGYYALSIPNGTKNIMYMNEGFFAKIDTTLIHMNKHVDVSLNQMTDEDFQINPFDTSNQTKIEVEEIANEDDTVNTDDPVKVSIKNKPAVNELIKYVLKRNFKMIDRIENGYIEVPGIQISRMPSLGGEIDVSRAIKHLPGVQPSTEMTNGMYVRGGSQDQNLVLIDGVPIYNMNHAFGLYSIFNSESINSINLTKSGFSSKHGGRLSAITDVVMKEGNKSGIHGIYLNSLLAFTLNLDGPLSRDGRTTFSIAARRSHWDIFFLRPFSSDSNKSSIAFYDVNLKVSHKINDRNKLVFSILSNRDRLFSINKTTDVVNNNRVLYENGTDVRWGNFAGSAKLNKVINEKLFSSTTFSYSQYKAQFGFSFGSSFDSANVTDYSKLEFKYFNFIRDYMLKVDYDYVLDRKHTLMFGANFSLKQFMPGTTATKYNRNGVISNDTFYGLSKSVNSKETALYLEDEYKINKDLKITFGGRLVSYIYKSDNFLFFEPRVSFNKKFDNRYAIKGSYTLMNQSIHLLADNINANLTDRWVPATGLSKPERSHQVSLGISKPLENDLEFSLEGYYKYYNRILELKEGVDINSGLLSSSEWENKVLSGTGKNYGLEAFLHKRRGNTTGWISYTLSWAKRNTPGVNRDQDYYFQFDRRHYVNLVAQTKLDEKYTASINVVFSTGNVQSVPIGKYLDINGNVIYDYSEKNNYRLNNTFRIDVGITKIRYKEWAAESGYRFSIYNILARNNPAYVYIDNSGKKPQAYQRAFLLFIPGVTYYIKF